MLISPVPHLLQALGVLLLAWTAEVCLKGAAVETGLIMLCLVVAGHTASACLYRLAKAECLTTGEHVDERNNSRHSSAESSPTCLPKSLAVSGR